MQLLVLTGLAVLAYVLLAPIVLFIRMTRLDREVATLKRDLARALSRDAAANRDLPAPEPAPETIPEPIPEPAVRPGPEPAEPAAEPDTTGPQDPTARAAAADTAAAPRRQSVEERLASRWMIWLGGLAVALSAVFLFSYAVEQGWLTPATRVALGLLLGGALLAGGEWSRRRPVARMARAMTPDPVPAALTASGLFAVYVSIYAAYAIFDLLPGAAAFAALALVCGAALLLGLRGGRFVALLGLVAGYLVPALVAPATQALPLFVYLGLLSAAYLGLMVWRKWWWFAALTMAGAFLWPLLWLIDRGALADQGVLSAYALTLAALFAALSTTLPVKLPEIGPMRWLFALVTDTAGLGFALSGGLVILLMPAVGFNPASLLIPVILGGVAVAVALWRPRLEGLMVLAAIAGLAGLLLWPPPAEVTAPGEIARLGTGALATAFGPYVMPPEFKGFARALWAMAAVFGLGGLLGLGRAINGSVWAGLSAAMPVLLFALAYWRIGSFEIDVQWAILATLLAGANLVAATLVSRSAAGPRRDAPLALYAAACTAALALAFACLLREAWLTVAMAAEVLALAWIWSRLGVAALRAVAMVALGAVIVRLIANPAVLDYGGPDSGLFGWVLYGYGLPAVAIGIAARLFAHAGRKDHVVALCEISAFGLGFLTVALQIKLWTSGSLADFDLSLLDRAVQSIWWLTAAAILLDRRITRRYGWARAAGIAILAATILWILAGLLGRQNPLGHAIRVGTWPVLNLLGLAYLLPALQLLALGTRSRVDLPDRLRRLCRGAAGVLVFVWLTLEVRRAFWGSLLLLSASSRPLGAEIYAYSAVWLLFALVVLAAGIRWRSVSLRYASLAVLIVTVAKVFLYDMSDLTGLFRVASFLGLGLTLIWIGRVYQKYVFAPDRPRDGEPPPRPPGPAA